MPPPGSSEAAVRGTQNSPLPPSVETAYYRKCIELKRRINEIEESNDAARTRKIRINRQILKMRLERAFLLEQLQRRMEFNAEDSDRSTSPPPTPQEKPLRSKRGHRKTTPPPTGSGTGNVETPGSSAIPGSGAPAQGYFDAAAGSAAPVPPPNHASASPYPPIQPQPSQSSPVASDSRIYGNGQAHAAARPSDTTPSRYDGADEEDRPSLSAREGLDGERPNGAAISATPGAGPAASDAEASAGAGSDAAGGFTAVNS